MLERPDTAGVRVWGPPPGGDTAAALLNVSASLPRREFTQVPQVPAYRNGRNGSDGEEGVPAYLATGPRSAALVVGERRGRVQELLVASR